MSQFPKVLVLFGPPGAGKSTQAIRVAERMGMHHFETSKMLEEELAGNDGVSLLTIEGEEYPLGEERRKYAAGEMVTPAVTAYLMENALRRLAQEGRSIVFSGSPRTLFEARKIFPLLETLFGKQGIWIFLLFIQPRTSLFRLQHRRVCAQCGLPHPWREETKHLGTCTQCPGLLHRRKSLDGSAVIPTRLHAYKEETAPAISFAEERGYPFTVLDGEPHEDVVQEHIGRILSVV